MNYTNVPKTVSFNGARLAEIKASIGNYPEEERIIRERAEKLLITEPYTVTKKQLVPPSGNVHDYMTMGTYWWPDPSKPDGLPYIRRDGEMNPVCKDRNSYGNMSNAAYHLAHAAYVFEREDYAKKALEILTVWHLDEETRMTPHAEYAQAIPGICEGRGIGIIDFARSFLVFDACEILYALGVMSDEVLRGIKSWYVDFINWMITSEKGIYEDNYFNNHGAWYDVQVLSAAIFTGRYELARRVAMNTYRRRHKTHIMADGAQPHELERTNAMSYSIMNLEALVRLAELSARYGCNEGVGTDAEAGVCLIEKGAQFLYPYAVDQKDFPYSQIKPSDMGARMCLILRMLSDMLGKSEYLEMAAAIEKPKYLCNVMPTF